MQFAETAREAWGGPATLKLRTRAFARRRALSLMRLVHRPATGNFVRCLCSHAVFPDSAGAFRDFLRALKSRGEIIDTNTLIEILREERPVDGRFFHLSFDDGLANVWETGGPLMADEQVPYTLFLATDYIGSGPEGLETYNKTLNYDQPVRTMSWNQVRDCMAAGGEMGCHTRSHVRLSGVSGDRDRLDAEIAGAKARIEQETGQPCIAFAWPFGKTAHIDARSIEEIETAGFLISFSAERGRVAPGVTHLMRVPRHQVEFHWPMWENLLWAEGCME